ncbi:MAG: hypothetical protein L0Z49_11895 [Actinobacteria bacterium]|nr:hypothetical protein [Actinomycetota bacterium]
MHPIAASRLLAVAVLLWSVALPAAAQTAPPIPDDSDPSLAADDEGNLHVVWVQGPPGEEMILYSASEGSTWSASETVTTGGSFIRPIVLVDPDGVPCVFWTVIALFESCRTETGWGEPVEIAVEAASSDFRPAYAPDGTLEVMHVEPPTGVYYGDQLLNPADEVVTFPEFAVDSDGGLHGFWYDFSEDRGWVSSYSADEGATWDPFQSLSLTLPQSTGTLVAADTLGRVHSVLMSAFRLEHRVWRNLGWSEPSIIEFTPGSIDGAITLNQDGRVTVVTATSAGALVFTIGPDGGDWSEEGPVEGTEDRSIDEVLAASGDDGTVVLWHETGAELFNQSTVGAPSLVSSVPSPSEINLDPVVIATSVALTAGMLFLAPFPAEIFNNTLADNYDTIRGWFRRRERHPGGFWERPQGLLGFLLVAALLFGFLDPGFGLNAASVPVLIGLVVGVAVTTIGFAVPTLLLRRRRTGEWGRIRALPIALVIGLVCVVLSRGIGFVPGYLYAIVVGLVFAREVARSDEARETTVSAVTLLVLGLASWVGLGSVRTGGGAGFGAEVVETALALITVAALEAVAFGLLPMRGLPGGVLFKEQKRRWLVIWGISVLFFFHVIVNPQSGYLVNTALVPVATTIALLVLFTVVTFGLWGFFAFKARRKTSVES